MSKSIQISMELFLDLVCYFENVGEVDETNIKKQLESKLNSLVNRELYSRYKDKTLTDQQREEARQKYLDSKGILPEFRW